MSKEQRPIGYTQKELGRLSTFQNILNRTSEQKLFLESGNPQVFGKTGADGRVSDKYFDVDSRFIVIWTHVAERMYQQEFLGKEHMRFAAESILETNREANRDDSPTVAELNELFSRE